MLHSLFQVRKFAATRPFKAGHTCYRAAKPNTHKGAHFGSKACQCAGVAGGCGAILGAICCCHHQCSRCTPPLFVAGQDHMRTQVSVSPASLATSESDRYMSSQLENTTSALPAGNSSSVASPTCQRTLRLHTCKSGLFQHAAARKPQRTSI